MKSDFVLADEIFLEHFAFIVFLFAYISHYVANAEICVYPALLVLANAH